MSGQLALNFSHPEFRPEEVEPLTRDAFRRKYEAHGPVMLNVIRTALAGYERMLQDIEARGKAGLRWSSESMEYVKGEGNSDDTYMLHRADMLRQRLCQFRPLLPSVRAYSPNRASRKRCAELEKRLNKILGPASLSTRLRGLVVLASATIEAIRSKLGRLIGRSEIIRQPPCRRTEYRLVEQ